MEIAINRTPGDYKISVNLYDWGTNGYRKLEEVLRAMDVVIVSCQDRNRVVGFLSSISYRNLILECKDSKHADRTIIALATREVVNEPKKETAMVDVDKLTKDQQRLQEEVKELKGLKEVLEGNLIDVLNYITEDFGSYSELGFENYYAIKDFFKWRGGFMSSSHNLWRYFRSSDAVKELKDVVNAAITQRIEDVKKSGAKLASQRKFKELGEELDKAHKTIAKYEQNIEFLRSIYGKSDLVK